MLRSFISLSNGAQLPILKIAGLATVVSSYVRGIVSVHDFRKQEAIALLWRGMISARSELGIEGRAIIRW